MSIHSAFRRQPVPQQMASRHEVTTLPAPVRGLVEIENYSYMRPAAAVILDNWFPTARGLHLRSGSIEWATLPAPAEPIISAFEYVVAGVNRMFCATPTRIFDVTFVDTPSLVVSGVTNGNYSGAQFSNQGGDWLLIVNDAGDFVRRYDGTVWEYLNADQILHTPTGTPPVVTPVDHGANLTFVWKYRNRLFFIEKDSMNAWYLPLNAVQGELNMIPLSGAATRGGQLLFGATWSTSDTGDGIDDRCVFVTTQGEVLVFVGTDPSDPQNWRQDGRFEFAKPMSKNGHERVGGDLLIETVEGIIPLSAMIQKDKAALKLAAITSNVEPLWKREVFENTSSYPWTMFRWDEQNALFANFPGKEPGNHHCLVINMQTGAICRYTGWDVNCFMKVAGNLFYGTQDGKIYQAERTGYDNAHFDDELNFSGDQYVALMVGGWEMFQSPPSQVTWLQSRVAFVANPDEKFLPQITATLDYGYFIPPPPAVSILTDNANIWDLGLWDEALWDGGGPPLAPQLVRNTMWVSVGMTGFSHAPILQVTIGQVPEPGIEVISIAATYLRMGDTV